MGKIYAFEPQSVLYKYLLKLKHLFGWGNITLEHSAVSDKTGKAMLCVPYNNGRPSSPCATIIDSPIFSNYQSQEEVSTVSLDMYCSLHGILPDFIKVDVEGNELSVFMGAEKILRLNKPRLLFECEARFVGYDTVIETFQFLQGLGYKGYFIMGEDILPITEFDLSYHQDLSAGVYCNNFIFE